VRVIYALYDTVVSILSLEMLAKMASLRYMLLLSKDVPSAAKFLSEGLGMSATVITEKWAELQSGGSTVAVKAVER
jgi:hypothetical protein